MNSERHGHYLGYVNDKCRCDQCREAWRAYQAKRSRDIAYRGREVTERVNPDRARRHILKLRDRGIGARTVEAATGISSFSIFKIAAGEREWIGADTEAAILSYKTPPLTALTDRSRIEGIGTHRRIRALQAIGWSLRDIAERVGCTGSNIGEVLRHDRVRAKTARAISEVYEDLWNKPAPEGYRRTKSLIAARANGWAPPLAWNDDEIDDPDATPDVGDTPDRVNGGTGRRSTDVAEDVAFLLEHDPTLTSAQLADRLGYQGKSAIQHALDRAGRRDLLARLARNAEERAA
jgi:hypothetical protein